MTGQKFLVRLVRPVFQAAYVEVEGKDENDAAFQAYMSAQSIPEEKWTGRYNPEHYHMEARCIRCVETTEGNAVSLLDFPDYCLLSTGESPFEYDTVQPWMDELYPWWVANYISKWIDSLIDHRGDYYEETIEFLQDQLKSLKGTDEKVVPLKPPAERRHDIDLIEATVDLVRILKETDA